MLLSTVFAVLFTIADSVLGFVQAVGMALYNGAVNIVNKFTSFGSIVFMIIMLALILVGLFPVYAPNTVIMMADASWETVIYPTIDWSVTYTEHLWRDFVSNPLSFWWNELVQHRWVETLHMRINNSRIIAQDDPTTVTTVSEIITQWADWLLLDVLFAPVDAPEIRWGPAHVRVPFVKPLIDAYTLFFVEGLYTPPAIIPPIISSRFMLALKNVTLTFVRLDVLSHSCFFQHMTTWDGQNWVLEGCFLFDTDYCPLLSDHISGTCAGCHNTSIDLIRATMRTVIDGWDRILNQWSQELLRVVHSYDVDVCSIIAGATCDPAAAASIGASDCTCSGVNGTHLDWWLRVPGIPYFHCSEGRSLTLELGLLGEPSCNAVTDLCAASAPGSDCALVDVSPSYSYVFPGRSCVDVDAAGTAYGAGIADYDCENVTACEIRDWSWWIDRVVERGMNVTVGLFEAITETANCEWNWMRAVFATAVLVMDPTCTYGLVQDWVSFLQTLWYYDNPMFLPVQCLEYTTNFVLQFQLEPLSTGLFNAWQVVREVGAASLDGSLLTRSCYFCTAVKESDHRCAQLDRRIDKVCTDLVDGVRIENARCADIGFRNSDVNLPSCYPSPCASGWNNSYAEICPYFNGTLCTDVSVIDPTPRTIEITWTLANSNVNCSFLNTGCWSVSNGDCHMFGGCRTFDGCTATNCHRYTTRFLSAINETVYGTSFNLLTWFGVSVNETRKVLALWDASFEAMECLADNLKSGVGFIILIADSGCTSTTTQNFDYLINVVLSGAVGCWTALADFFNAVGSLWLHNRINVYIEILQRLVPDIWSGDFLRTNSYYCNIWPELVIVETVAEPLPRTWIFDGCPGFRDGECEDAWQAAVATSFVVGGMGSVLPGMTFGDPYGDVILEVGIDVCNITTMALNAIGMPEFITTHLVNIIYDTFKLVADLLVNGIRNIIGWLILIFSTSCTADAIDKTYYTMTDVLLWYINVPINYIIDVIVEIWDILETAIIALIRKFNLLGWIFDAADDVAIMTFCFSADVPINGTGRVYYVGFADKAPNFMKCAQAWPGEFYIGRGCALHTCFDYAWMCVAYNMTNSTNDADWVERQYNWFGDFFGAPWIGDVVSAILYAIDIIVCPCSTDDIRTFTTTAYQYNCPDKCIVCDTTDQYWYCLAECVLSHAETDIVWYPLHLGGTKSPTMCHERLRREGVQDSRWAHTDESNATSPWTEDYLQDQMYAAPYDKEVPDDVWGKLKSIMSWGFRTRFNTSMENPSTLFVDATGNDWNVWWHYVGTPGSEWPWIGRDDTNMGWATYKAMRANEFCNQACAGSAAYTAGTTTQKTEYAAACRAFRTYMPLDSEHGVFPPQSDCSANIWQTKYETEAWGVPGIGASFWCGNLTLYGHETDANRSLRLRSFRGFMCDKQMAGDSPSIPDTSFSARVVYGEQEALPVLARLLWATYLSHAHKTVVPYDYNSGLDEGVSHLGGSTIYRAARNLATCSDTWDAASTWKPFDFSNSTYAFERASRVFYDMASLPSIPVNSFSHCAAGTLPVNESGASWLGDYIRAHFFQQIPPLSAAKPGSGTKKRAVASDADDGFPLPFLPTSARLREEAETGKRAPRSGDDDFEAMARGAYEDAQWLGSMNRPYRNPAAFAAKIADDPCPVLPVAGCFCEAYLSDCAAAVAKYAPGGSASFAERASFRYCSQAWDAYANAPDDAARADATNMLCVTDAGRSVTERASAVLRGFFDAAPSETRRFSTSASQPTSKSDGPRLLNPAAIFGPDLPDVAKALGALSAPRAIRNAAAVTVGAIADAYPGSWLENAVVSGRRLRAARDRGTMPSSAAEFEWIGGVLGDLDATLEAGAEIRRQRGPVVLRANSPTNGAVKLGLASADSIRSHGRNIDSEGRGPLGRLIRRAVATVQREIGVIEPGSARAPRATAETATGTGSMFSVASITTMASGLTSALKGYLGSGPRADRTGQLTARNRARAAFGGNTKSAEAETVVDDGWWFKLEAPVVPNRPHSRDSPFDLGPYADRFNKYKPVVVNLWTSFVAEIGVGNSTILRAAGDVATLTGADRLFALFGSWIRDIFVSFIDKIDADGWASIFTSIGNWILDVFACEYPEQVNTTQPYNLFCFPRIPEGTTSTVPAGPFTPEQIAWGTEIIAVQCINVDWADGRLPCTDHYYSLHLDNCKYNDTYTPLRPGCPTTPWCRRSYDLSTISMDIVDAGIMLVHQAAKLLYKLLYPAIGTLNATSVDRVHWAINFLVLLFLPAMVLAIISAIPFIGFIGTWLGRIAPELGWTLAIWYAIVSKVMWPALVFLLAWYMVSIAYNVALWIIYIPFFVFGGWIWAYPDIVGWLATGVCAFTDPGFSWWLGAAETLCVKLRTVAEHGDDQVYLQVWGLYFAKTLFIVLFSYVATVALAQIAVAVVSQTVHILYNFYFLIRTQLMKSRIAANEAATDELRTNTASLHAEIAAAVAEVKSTLPAAATVAAAAGMGMPD